MSILFKIMSYIFDDSFRNFNFFVGLIQINNIKLLDKFILLLINFIYI